MLRYQKVIQHGAWCVLCGLIAIYRGSLIMENVYKVGRFWHEIFKRWYYTDDGGLSWYPEEGAAFNDYVNERMV